MAGLNVFMLDTDVVFFHDPYIYLKGAELRDYSLVCLSDSSVDSAKANGGVWYLQNVVPHGPIAQQLLAAFEERTLRLINSSSPRRDILPPVRYTDYKPGAAADRLLDDQWVINNAILASVAVGSPVLVNSHTAEDFKGRLPRFWAAEGRYRPTPADLGTYGIHYPPHYKLRERAISQGNVTENLMQA